MDGPRNAVCLLSGGLDSCVAMALALRSFEVYPLAVSYGQRHGREIEAAKNIVEYYQMLDLNGEVASLVTVAVDYSGINSSALLGDEPIPDTPVEEIGKAIPPTYVPARNFMLLSLAASYAAKVKAEAIFAGFNAVDYSGYPDCREDFVGAFQKALDCGMKPGCTATIHVPLIAWTKAQIIEAGEKQEAPLHLTWSCYAGGPSPCNKCDSCKIRAAGFEALHLPDPILVGA